MRDPDFLETALQYAIYTLGAFHLGRLLVRLLTLLSASAREDFHGIVSDVRREAAAWGALLRSLRGSPRDDERAPP